MFYICKKVGVFCKLNIIFGGIVNVFFEFMVIFDKIIFQKFDEFDGVNDYLLYC